MELQRNPRYSGLDVTCLWDIRILASHFLPIVLHLANQILQAGFIESQLLEKICKQSLEKDIKSGIDVKLKMRKMKLNSIEFTKKSQSDVASHEQFFFKFFAENPAMQRRKRIIKKKLEEKTKKSEIKEEIGKGLQIEVQKGQKKQIWR
ncbi:MAG: hypothetical protein EZS28_015591 [Streblomastix strix]|uniref:Uncharacterized protein n=1 Tax=Streblomastix strix TaxID=222440 RepID=A0A5J4W1N9_9EUKA|nr:MAG: hypothetical protein EZS28_015591 [Streblomastix strix]